MNFNLGEFSPELKSIADRVEQIDRELNSKTPPHTEASTSSRRQLEIELALEDIKDETHDIETSSNTVQPNQASVRTTTTLPMSTDQQLAELRALLESTEGQALLSRAGIDSSILSTVAPTIELDPTTPMKRAANGRRSSIESLHQSSI